MTAAPVARVAVPAPLHGLFDYRIDRHARAPVPGMRVSVPFGARKLVGVVMQISSQSSLPASRLKAITEVLDEQPCLDPAILQLLQWCAAYYHHPVGEVVQAALPLRLRQRRANKVVTERCWHAQVDSLEQALPALAHAPKQRQLLRAVLEQPGISESQLNARIDNWRNAMQSLQQKGLVRETPASSLTPPAEQTTAHTANAGQQQVIDAIGKQMQQHAVHLLHGVTGSGKTEVYIRLAQQAIGQRRQVLLLVPEISLTPQLTERLAERLPHSVGVIHSALGDVERHRIWHAASRGELAMLVGTRSAVFTPMPRLGLILVDEEHDNSYKQQDGFRYHARDVAIVRAKQSDIPIVLGSATPSLESLHNAEQQRYRLHRLDSRAAGSQRTRLQLIDMRRQPIHEGLSDALLQQLEAHIGQGNQVMLFLNRRGFAPLLLCHDCGWTTRCHRCDAHMTFHKARKRLRCHHCDSETPVPTQCGACGGSELIALGSGTERIESFLQQRFGDSSICRIDRDTTRRKGALQHKLEQVRSGEAQILIGTQMLAKGHDFPDVTLVGILDTDQALYSADFRAPEHMAQLVVQVAGRAGRGHKPGEVLIQTHHPDHPLLQTLLHQGYRAFCRDALCERQAAGLPPYSHMMILRAEASRADVAQTFMQQARDTLSRQAEEAVSLFGPVAAPMEKRAGRWRSQLILQSAERRPLHQCVRAAIAEIAGLPAAKKVRWSLDVDPVDTY